MSTTRRGLAIILAITVAAFVVGIAIGLADRHKRGASRAPAPVDDVAKAEELGDRIVIVG